jgi:tetratricopeptide (TPR) repeat protein
MAVLSTNPGRARRLVSALALPIVLALGVSGCGADDPVKPPVTATDAKAATTALEAGLKAHADGDLAAATADYNKVLTLDATNKFAFYNLALIDVANSNYGLAEAHYRSAIKSDAKYEPALFNLAILRTTADPKEAISLYKRAVAANAKDAAAWLNLGLLLRSNGNKAEGDKDVLKAIALNPSLKDPTKAVTGSNTVEAP